MASSRNIALRDWDVAHDSCHMLIWVDVDQVFGTRASMRLDFHRSLPHGYSIELAKYSSDSRDNSEEAIRNVLAALLKLDENRRAREAELTDGTL